MSTTVDPRNYQVNDEQEQVRDSLVAMFAVAAVFVALRFFVRTRLQAQVSTDDWLLLLSLCGYLVMTIFIILAINEGGFGRKTGELAVSTFYVGAKYVVLAQVTYTLAMLIAKLSIALLQLRIIGQGSKIMRQITFASIGVNFVMGLYEFFALLFQCTPPKKYWTPTMTTGHCAERKGVATGVYVYSAVNLVLDFYYALALAPMVWRLQMRTVVKISTMFVLGMGVFAGVANIIRFKSLIGYAQETDILYIFIPIAIWTWAEMCLALAAASIATFRPLVRMLPWANLRNGSGKYPSNQSPFTTWRSRLTPRRRRDPLELSDMDITNATVRGNERDVQGSGATGSSNLVEDSESQKYILKEQEVEVRRETWR